MDDHERERAWVGALYPGSKWKKQVKKMPDSQILAIYIREHGKARAKPKPKPKPKEDDVGF